MNFVKCSPIRIKQLCVKCTTKMASIKHGYSSSCIFPARQRAYKIKPKKYLAFGAKYF